MWLIYALGGGFGHLTRASALARALPAETKVRILTNSPYAACVQRGLPELDLIVLDAAMEVDEVRREVRAQIAAANPDCLIVDTFARGLLGELVDILPGFLGRKVLVQRDLNPRYAAAFDIRAFAERSYDLILSAEDGPGFTAPWLIRSAEELPARDAARGLLGLRNDRPCVLVCAAGNVNELAWYGEVAAVLSSRGGDCEVRCIAMQRPESCPAACWLPYWPAMNLYAGADVVVGGGGYHTVYECLACGVPLVCRPWSRKYDRQQVRARLAACIVETPEEAAAAALRLAAAPAVRELRPYFHNGTHDAVRLLHPMERSDIH